MSYYPHFTGPERLLAQGHTVWEGKSQNLNPARSLAGFRASQAVWGWARVETQAEVGEGSAAPLPPTSQGWVKNERLWLENNGRPLEGFHW